MIQAAEITRISGFFHLVGLPGSARWQIVGYPYGAEWMILSRHGRTNDVATLLFAGFRNGLGLGPMDGQYIFGASRGRKPRPILLLSLLLFPAQLLAQPGSPVAGEAGQSLYATAGLHGLPAVQGKQLAI